MIARLAEALADRYRIEREVGQGGMATVYVAHDIRHNRDVAIKVLHPDLGAALGAERFLTEIRTTARLQHPHILPLLDSGDAAGLLYYVMPLVTGETLRARLERERQLPVNDAIAIAREVADALGYAHGLGVVHRDIKPENILLQGGHALVADFGIALAVQTAGGQRMTQTGLSLGTPQYMSPEQAMGERTIDARSDLYSLAAVTYEMLIGEAPFTGPTVQAIVARVMSEEPRGLVMQRKAIPDHVEDAVLRGIEKLPADRWGSAREFADALQGAETTSSAHRTTSSRRGGRSQAAARRRSRLLDPLVLLLGATTIGSVAFAAWTRRPASDNGGDVVRFAIPAPASAGSLGFSTIAISPDGRTLAFAGRSETGRSQLMVRRIDEITPRALPGTEDGDAPVFSPDSRSVAFYRGNQIFRTSLDGGTPQLLGAAVGTFGGMSWSATGKVIVSGNIGLYTLAETGGQLQPFVVPDREGGELYQTGPVVLEDDGVMLYTSWGGAAMPSAKIAIVSLKDKSITRLDLPGIHPIGVANGALLYVTFQGALMAVPIDIGKRRLLGVPVQVLPGIMFNRTTAMARVGLSRTGTLFYQEAAAPSRVIMVSGDQRTPLELEEAEYGFPRLSPDASQLALSVIAGDRRDIWLFELRSGTKTRFTTEGSINERPEWTPDGSRVLFRTDRGARNSIWWRPANQSAPATPLLASDRAEYFEAVISPDSRYIAYQLDTAGADVYYRSLVGGASTPVAVANSSAIEAMPRISPDGRWIAFITDESGRNEVVMQPFPGPGGRVQVSSDGGVEPVWSRDGRRLLYRTGRHVMGATIQFGPASAVVTRRDTLFEDRYAYAINPHANYDVLPDGERFIFLEPVRDGNLIVVANWSSLLRAQMQPAN